MAQRTEKRSFQIECDTVLLSVGLIPENEISKKAGISLNPETGGPYVDASLMTDVPGIFACGNVLHVHDLVDFVSEESRRCGAFVLDYLAGSLSRRNVPVVAGSNVKYVVPNQCNPDGKNHFYLRSMVVRNNSRLRVAIQGREVLDRKLRHVQPSEMISFSLTADDIGKIRPSQDAQLEIAIDGGDERRTLG